MNLSKLQNLVGKTIESVDWTETDDGNVYTVKLCLTNGDVVEFSPTNYNYGGQNLNVEFE